MVQLCVKFFGKMDVELSRSWDCLASVSLNILSYLSLNDEEFACPEVYDAICNILQNNWNEPVVKKWVGYAINTEIEAESDMSDIYKRDWKVLYREEFDPAIWG
jgi:hypothetical protein